ncbi:MAG: T9SS type A sorting domain-containing protein [Saprospiraceae bacterium]
MKNYFIIIAILGNISFVKGQELDIKFDNIMPRWHFYFNDTNYVVGNQTQIDEKTSIVSGLIPIVNKDYAFVVGTQFNHEYQYDGGPICKVKLDDGSLVWTKYFNTSNLDDQNLVSYATYIENVLISGRKRTKHSKLNDTQWDLGGFSVPFVREINGNNGDISNEYFDRSDSIGTFDVLFKYFIYPFGNNIFQIYRDGQDSLVGIKVEKFKQETGQTEPLQFLLYKESIQPLKYNKFKWYHYKNSDSTLIILYAYQNTDNSAINGVAGIELFVLENDTFKSKKYLDISDYFLSIPKSSSFDFIWIINNNRGDIILSKSFQEKGINKIKYWFIKFDNELNISQYIPEVKLDSLNFSYNSVIPFYSDPYSTYMIGQTSLPDVKGMDVLQIKNDGAIRVLGHLTTGPDNFKISGIRLNMNDKGNIILAGIWDKKAMTVMGFHISDFGINLSSEDQGLTPSKPLITLTPNPAGDDVSIYITDHQYHKGTTFIYDVSGQLVQQAKIRHGDKLEIRSLKPGTYIVQYAPESRPGYFLTGKLVKP